MVFNNSSRNSDMYGTQAFRSPSYGGTEYRYHHKAREGRTSLVDARGQDDNPDREMSERHFRLKR